MAQNPQTESLESNKTEKSSRTPGIEGDTDSAQNQPTSSDKTRPHRRGEFVVAPLPISSPALGTGIVPVVGYIFPISTRDKTSPPSTIGGAGLVTDNGSRAVALAGTFYFKEDSYHATVVYARGNLNYDLYGIGIAAENGNLKLPLKQTGQLFFGELLRGIG